jgi:poly-gamma-glutamate capsule biosynthesis protein CapA/YwtB (metallophosphatase superfamily)
MEWKMIMGSMLTYIKRWRLVILLLLLVSVWTTAAGAATASNPTDITEVNTEDISDTDTENSEDNKDDLQTVEEADVIKEYTGELSFASASLSLQVGDVVAFEAILTEENLSGEKVVYKSSNKKIVTVTKDGTIEAVHYGKAKVTATLGKATATCKITVSKDVTLTISAAGDVTLSSDIKQPASVNFFSVYNKQKDASYFFRNVKPIFEKDDMTIVNFEGTLSDRGSRVDKQWAFRGKPSYIKILTEGSVEAVAFANNHVRDYGAISYTDTIDSFDKEGIVYSSDSRIGIYETKGLKIGMISIQQTSRSDYKTVLRKAIKQMKKEKPDLLIVSFHWGVERTSTITATQRELGRIAIDEGGANLVLGHHPHVLQPIEKYKDAYIVYSLGNFCFGGNTNPPDKDTMIYQQTFAFHNDKLVPSDEVRIIPCSVSSTSSRNNYQPTPSTGKELQRILKKINSYCKPYGITFDKKGGLITDKK